MLDRTGSLLRHAGSLRCLLPIDSGRSSALAYRRPPDRPPSLPAPVPIDISEHHPIAVTPSLAAGASEQAQLRVFEQRFDRRAFFSAPQSVVGFLAAVLEPFVAVASLLAAHAWYAEPFDRAAMALALLVIALSFPGAERFRDAPLAAAVDIVTTWLSLAAILVFCGYATKSLGYYQWNVILLWLLATPLVHWLIVFAGRQWITARSRQPQAQRRAVIVGAGALGVRVASVLPGRVGLQTAVLGYFDDRHGERVHADARGLRLGGLAEVAAYVEKSGAGEVYITLPLGSQPRIVALLESLQGTTASIYFAPDVFGISIIQGRLQDVGGVPVVGICETPFTGINDLVKRCCDLVLASVILALLAPLMLALALGVRLTSAGPALFRQRRNGLGGEEITIYKFRTMRVQEDGPAVRQASRGDARITPFGAFLRRTSLDELPQFLNVLQGRMSIVGPRPHAIAHNEQYRQLIKAYMVRHKVRPGITGWAQVNGHRGETETVEKMRARIEYDLEYLRNWSLGLDLQIIARTIKLVVGDRHAF